MFTKSSIQTYLALSEQENATLKKFINTIEAGSIQEKKSATQELKDYSPQTIFKLSENSPVFKDFCKNSQEQLPYWAAALQDGGYPGNDISSIDSGIKCTTLDQYVGIFIFKEYLKEKAKSQDADPILLSFLLNKACQHRILFALVERCQVHIDALHYTNIPSNLKEKIPDKIKEDIDLLTTLYQSLGYGHACKVHLMLGHYYSGLPSEDYGYLVKKEYDMAVHEFCCAEITANTEYSQLVNQFVLGEKNYFEHVFGLYFKNWQIAKDDYILKFIGDDISLYNSLHTDAEKTLEALSPKPLTLGKNGGK
jgi:hypothetical protein